MRKPYFILLVLMAALGASAQNGVVTTAVNNNQIVIGQPLQVTIQASFSKPHAIAFPPIDSLPHFEVLSQSKIDTVATADQIILKQILTLTSWDSGTWALPAFTIAGTKGAAAKPLLVTVSYTPTPAGKDYNDIKDIIEVQKPPRQTWYWYVIGAALLALFALLLFPPNKKSTPAEKTLPKEGAYKQALHQLEALKEKSDMDDSAYFTELILIFRTYLQHGKHIHSFQKTSDDLGRQLSQLQLPHEDLKKLIATLQLSDFVKFARYAVPTNERAAAWAQIKKSIVAIEPLDV